MDKSFVAYILKVKLDTVLPLDNGAYQISGRGLDGITLTVENTFEKLSQFGSFSVHGDVHIHQGHGHGVSDIVLEYKCGDLLSVDEFAEKMSISSVWHMSPTGMDFVLEDINRIIDLYRCFGNAYWWNHISMWNVDEINIFGKLESADDQIFISQSSSPKAVKFGGEPFEGIVYNDDSRYLKDVRSGEEIPFYYLIFLNGRRSFVEHAFREALVNWSNCIEAYGMYLLSGACHVAELPRTEREEHVNAEYDYKKCYSKAYEILAKVDVYPSVKKKKAIQLLEKVMEHRNDVMHGRNPNIGWSAMGEKLDALGELLGIAPELSI